MGCGIQGHVARSMPANAVYTNPLKSYIKKKEGRDLCIMSRMRVISEVPSEFEVSEVITASFLN